MQIRKQQRHRKYMRTKETAFDKEKKNQGRDALSSILGIATFHVFLKKLERFQGNTTFPLTSPQKPKRLKSTDNKLIYSWSKIREENY